jgi:uncharacterized membrane protein YbhN (UPF0104 family)
MDKFSKKSLIVIFFLIIVLLFARYIYIHWSEFSQLKVVSPAFIIAIMILTALFSLSYGIVIKSLLEAFNIKLRFKEYFGLSIITGFYNLIAPLTGGVIPRAIYLKKKHNFKYRLFISSLSGMYVTHFFAGSILGIIGLLLIKFSQNVVSWPIIIVFSALLFLSAFLISFSPKIKESKIRWLNPLIHSINGWHTIRNNKRTVWLSIAMSVAQNIINMLGILLTFNIFGIKITLIQAFFLSCTAIVGGFMITTPGIIGLSEIIAVFASSIIGVTVPQALAVAISGRVISTATILILGPIYSGILLKHYNLKSEAKKIRKVKV